MTHAPSLQVAFASGFHPIAGLRFMQRSVLALMLGTGLLAAGLPLVNTALANEPATPATPVGLTDGTYVFGESPTPGMIGVNYMVVKVEGQQVVGGFYQPSSSFDCFRGQIEGNTLALNILAAFEEPPYQYTLALETTDAIASQGGAMLGALVPSGFHPVSTLTDVDHTVLAACQAMR